MNSAVFLYVPPGVQIDIPLENILYQNSQTKSPFNVHVLIVAEENSKLTFEQRIETINSAKNKNSANILIEIIAKDNALIKFFSLNNLSSEVSAYISNQIVVGQAAQVEVILGEYSLGNVINDCNIDLKGQGSVAKLNINALASSWQTQVINSQVNNLADNSIAMIEQKGVAKDCSSLLINGLGTIKKFAKSTKNEQVNKLLLLSKQAQGAVNPILEIDDNDVVASHSASIAKIAPEDLYYLMSRGLPLKKCEELLVKSFLNSFLREIADGSLRRRWLEVMERKLNA
jgi:Fe-S cluster assembly protein SufD